VTIGAEENLTVLVISDFLSSQCGNPHLTVRVPPQVPGII